jgi:lipopolysaccharide biosynthesis glycosyltransferase
MTKENNFNNKNICIATVTTDSFVVGTLVTIYSFLKYNSWFDGNIVIIYNELSEQSREYLKLVYDKIKFFSVGDEMLEKVKGITKVFPEFSPKQARFYSLETFRLRDYEKVLFLDSDLLFRGSIEDLFETEHNFVACGDGAFYNKSGRRWGKGLEEIIAGEEIEVLYNTFNSGFFLVDKTLLNDENYAGLLNLVDSRIYKTPNMKLADQVVLNIYFSGQQQLVSGVYNYLLAHRAPLFEMEKLSFTDARVLHFNGHHKPWMMDEVLRNGLRDGVFIKSCGFWFESYAECLQKLYLQTKTNGFHREKI